MKINDIILSVNTYDEDMAELAMWELFRDEFEREIGQNKKDLHAKWFQLNKEYRYDYIRKYKEKNKEKYAGYYFKYYKPTPRVKKEKYIIIKEKKEKSKLPAGVAESEWILYKSLLLEKELTKKESAKQKRIAKANKITKSQPRKKNREKIISKQNTNDYQRERYIQNKIN